LRAIDAALRAQFIYNEEQRIQALLRLSITGTGAEAEFDAITAAAQSICNSSAALITFVDADTCWFKSNKGSFEGSASVPRGVSVCSHLVQQPDLFCIEDLAVDERTKDNPMVLGPPYMRSYFGAPLLDPVSGQCMGALCVIDLQPRSLTAVQTASLQLLAKQCMAVAESRSRILNLQAALQQLEETKAALAESKEQAIRAQQQAEKAKKQAEHALHIAEKANNAKSEFLANSQLAQDPLHSAHRACGTPCRSVVVLCAYVSERSLVSVRSSPLSEP
jgi:GAF domain-containing protein